MHYKRWQIHGDPRGGLPEVVNLSFNRKEEIIKHLEAHKRINGDCWEWTRSLSHGYGHQIVDGKWFTVPRISAYLFLGVAIDTKLDICHHCDNRACFNPAHLYEGTRKQNMLDRSVRGRHGIAKLFPEDVREIRRLLGEMVPQSVIARKFGVSQGTISNINLRKIWLHVV